ncbi:hypothetical protein WJX73_007613 [Symbiochloris irregularis]|uniref:Glutamate decarboxylase n=1 Tax=Symbiochloris irregularis TaxID=706552 RepID=A0AAW1PJ18_9CHLO
MCPTADTSQDLIGQITLLLCDYLRSQGDQSQPVSRVLGPEQLQQVFAAAGIPLSLEDSHEGTAPKELLAAVRLALQYSVRTGSPKFLNQLYARADPISLAADWLVSALNCNVHTYEAAPVLTAVEVEVLDKLAACIGEPYTSTHDGLFVPGGSLSNYYGIHLARNRADPQYKQRGSYGGPCMVAFTSEHAHYSYLKAAFVTGLGTDNLISIPCDAAGGILPDKLEQAINSAKAVGKVPFFVGATAGTTVLGGFDPFQDLAAICTRHNLWLHIDGAWGAACLLSPRHRHLMEGCEQADSLAWNPHKLMGLPLQCAAFLTRHPGMLKASCGANASYLFGEDRLHADYDLGDKTMLCGRRGDAFKLWLEWKAYGTAGFARKVEHSFRLAEHFEKAVRASGGKFALVQARSYVNVCFWWVPPPMRPFTADSAPSEALDTLAKVTPAIKSKMQHAGDALINFQPLGSLPNFFRIVFSSALSIREEDLDGLLNRMDQYGQGVWQAARQPDLQPML